MKSFVESIADLAADIHRREKKNGLSMQQAVWSALSYKSITDKAARSQYFHQVLKILGKRGGDKTARDKAKAKQLNIKF